MKFFQKKFRGQTYGRTSDPGKRGGKPPSVNATYLRFGIIDFGEFCVSGFSICANGFADEIERSAA